MKDTSHNQIDIKGVNDSIPQSDSKYLGHKPKGWLPLVSNRS